MKTRNFYFGGFSLLVAGAAIAGGAAVSSSAMADGGSPAGDLNTVHVISIADGGEAIECEYDGIDLTATWLASPVGGGDGVIAVSGTATIDGSVPEGVEPMELGDLDGSFSVTVGDDGVVTSSEGSVVEIGTSVDVGGGTVTLDGEAIEAVELTPQQMEDMIGEMQIVFADDARPGTPEECAAMQPVPATPADLEG